MSYVYLCVAKYWLHKTLHIISIHITFISKCFNVLVAEAVVKMEELQYCSAKFP